jgi:hypothetical protein
MAVLDPQLKAQIEADPRVRQLLTSSGTVSTEQLRALGYQVPDHTKYAASMDGKGFRSRGGAGFAYNDEAGTASKLVTAGALGVMAAPLVMAALPSGAAAAGGGASSGATPLATSTPTWASQAALSGQVAPAAGFGAGAAPGSLTLASAAAPVSQGVINGTAVTGGVTGAQGTPVANGVLTAANNPGAALVSTTPAANPWAALLNPVSLVNAGLNLFNGWQASNAAKDAAEIQAAAAREATGLQREMFDRTQKNIEPWLAAGTGAVTTLAGLMGLPMMQPGGTQPQSGPGATAIPRQVAPVPLGGVSRIPPEAQRGVTLGGLCQPSYRPPDFNPNARVPAAVNRGTSYAPLSQ